MPNPYLQYGVSRGGNDVAEAAATKVLAAAAAAAVASAPSAKAAKNATKTKKPNAEKGARDFSNTFDRHMTEIVLANRNLQLRKEAEKVKAATPFTHNQYATMLRKTILSGDVAALPKTFKGGAAPVTDHTKMTRPLDIDGGGRPVKRGEPVDPEDLDAEMAALVDIAVDEAKEKKEAEAAAKASAKAKSKSKKGAPAWALSAAEADEKEAAEEEELLAFADNLDFDMYVETIDEEDLDEVGAVPS